MTKTPYRLERRQHLPRPRAEVFDFFADAGNLEAITPPFLRFHILSPRPIAMRAGARIDYSLAIAGIPFKWRTHITHWEPGVCFVDEQESGPYSLWRHSHRFEDDGQGTSMTDTVEYALPLGPIGGMARWLFVRRMLDHIFDYRQDAIARELGGTR